MSLSRPLLLLILCAGPLICTPAGAAISVGQNQEGQEEQDNARAGELMRNAIKARGGDAYLNIKEMTSRGEYTRYEKGASTLPVDFLDYIANPDKERTEFGKGGHRTILANSGETGWTYDAEAKLIKDQTEQQVKDYLQGARYDLDNLMKRGWKESGSKLVYLGRREAWKDTFSEAIRIEFSDGANVTIHFDRRTGLPMMVEFKRVGEDGPKNEQVRYYQWLDYNGVKFPKIQDSYRDGKQTSRVYYDTITFNTPIPARLFEKPSNPKEVK